MPDATPQPANVGITGVLAALPGLKSGIKSTEFYLSLGAFGTFISQALESSNSDTLQLVSLICAAIVSAAYTFARGLAKKNAAKA